MRCPIWGSLTQGWAPVRTRRFKRLGFWGLGEAKTPSLYASSQDDETVVAPAVAEEPTTPDATMLDVLTVYTMSLDRLAKMLHSYGISPQQAQTVGTNSGHGVAAHPACNMGPR